MSLAGRAGERTVVRTYKYRLYPTRAQIVALVAQLAACCDLYNAALEHRRWMWREYGVSVSYGEQSAELRALRALGLVPAAANFWCQQAVLRRLDRAFEAFFGRLKAGQKPGFPRFRSRRRFDTLTWTLKGNAGGVGIKHDRLRLQGVGAVKVKWHRALPAGAQLGEVKVTRSGDGRRWYVSISVELPAAGRARAAASKAVGIDLGVADFAALSTGERVPGPNASKRTAARTRRAARTVARRKRGSNRRRKAAVRLARQREREANRRRDHAHKLSRRIAEEFALIGMEDLRIGNMVRSASGTVAEPGINVSQKRGLNRAIADQGWGQFQQFVADKAEEAGRQLVKVNPANTSRTCSACGHVDARSRNGKRFWCVACGYRADADVNAAKVILARALAQAGVDRPGWGRQARTPALADVA